MPAWRGAAIAVSLLVCAAARGHGQGDSASPPATGGELQINPEGHAIPAFDEFQQDPTKVTPVDTDPNTPGWETVAVGPLEGPNGQRASRFSTGGVVWAYVWVPPDGKAHLVRDPLCSGKFTERFDDPIPDLALVPPECARAGAAAAPSGEAAPAGEAAHAVAQADTPATTAATAEKNPVPSLEGFTKREDRSMRIDTDPSQPGEETIMEAFEGSDGTAIGRLTTGSVTWAYGITPGGRIADSYFILDADCSGAFAQKLPATAQFGPPPCAQRAASTGAATDAPATEAFGLPQYAPADTSAAIVEVGLSGYASTELPKNSAGELVIDPARVGTEFGDDTRHILAWVRWEGAPAGAPVDLQWFFECQRITESKKVISNPDGSATAVLQQEGSPKLPPGGYRVEIFESGKRVATIPFRIGTAPPANAAHGSVDCVAGGSP